MNKIISYLIFNFNCFLIIFLKNHKSSNYSQPPYYFLYLLNKATKAFIYIS